MELVETLDVSDGHQVKEMAPADITKRYRLATKEDLHVTRYTMQKEVSLCDLIYQVDISVVELETEV